MNKTAKKRFAKETAESLKKEAAIKRQTEKEQQEKRDKAIQLAIAQNNKRVSVTSTPFQQAIAKKAPKLFEDTVFQNAIQRLENFEGLRNISAWKPQGKGKTSQFVSLANHLFAKYPTPKFLWSVFLDKDLDFLGNVVVGIARGGSLAKMCQDGEFPLPLTKKQCHLFLQSTADYTFVSALRRVQILTHGGDIRLFNAWMASNIGRTINRNSDPVGLRYGHEIWWDRAIAWFAKNPMLDLNQLGPMIDYLSFKHNQDADFSMKGRSVLALIRAMNEWHGELQKEKNFKYHNFVSSGFKGGNYVTKKGDKVTSHWNISEILNSRDLAQEGRALSHCVYSYSQSILSGKTSIWSLTKEGEKAITIEVSNAVKRVMQIRGKYNRVSTSEEFKIIQRWASDNSLAIF